MAIITEREQDEKWLFEFQKSGIEILLSFCIGTLKKTELTKEKKQEIIYPRVASNKRSISLSAA